MRVLFIQAGGTIDKDYPRKNQGYAFEIGEPAITRVMERIEVSFDYQIISLMQKDSLDMTDDDRALLKAHCEKSESTKVIITHGSDTLVESAKAIGNIPGKTIILTGAYRPERFSNSDADFNLGVAVGALNILGEGTFIAMNGTILTPERVQKNPETGIFEKA